jgi:hypothetical protein
MLKRRLRGRDTAGGMLVIGDGSGGDTKNAEEEPVPPTVPADG